MARVTREEMKIVDKEAATSPVHVVLLHRKSKKNLINETYVKPANELTNWNKKIFEIR